MDAKFTIGQIERFTAALDALMTEHPQIAAAIEYAQTLIQSRPFESGFVIGGLRYFTTASVPSFNVFFKVDEERKQIWLLKIEKREEAE
jgi:hypothetical protein